MRKTRSWRRVDPRQGRQIRQMPAIVFRIGAARAHKAVEARKLREPYSRFDIGYADEITPVLAQPERSVPNGTRAG